MAFYELSPPKKECMSALGSTSETGSPTYLILGYFSGSTRIHFETVQVGKSRTRLLYIRNPTETACAIKIVKMPKEFQLSCSEEEIIAPTNQLEIKVTWSPKTEGSVFESVPIQSSLTGVRLSFQLLGKSEPAPRPGKMNKRRPLVMPNSRQVAAPRAKDPSLKINSHGPVGGITVPISPNFTHRNKKEGETEIEEIFINKINEIVEPPPRDDALDNFAFPFTPEPISKKAEPLGIESIRRETFSVDDDPNFLPPNGIGSPLRRETFNVFDSPLGAVPGEGENDSDETERASESLEISGDQQSLNETVREAQKGSKGKEEREEDLGDHSMSISSESSKTEEFINIAAFDLKPTALAFQTSIKSGLSERIHELIVSGFEKNVIIQTLEKDATQEEIEEELKVYFLELCSSHTSIGRKFEFVKATFDSESFILLRLQLREIIGALGKEINVDSKANIFLVVSYLIETFDLECLWAAASLLFNDPNILVDRQSVRAFIKKNLEGDLYEGELSGRRNQGKKFIEKFFTLVILLDGTRNPLIFNPTYYSTKMILSQFADLYLLSGIVDEIPVQTVFNDPWIPKMIFENLKKDKMTFEKLLVLTEELIKGEGKNKFLIPSASVDLSVKEQSVECLKGALRSLNALLNIDIPQSEAEWMFYNVSHHLTHNLFWRILVRVRVAGDLPSLSLNETF